MHFHNGNINQIEGITDGNRGMGISPKIDHHSIYIALHQRLNSLHQFPFDCLKVDKAFIRGEQHRELVSAILAMARSLGLSVIAEGTETAEQVAMVREMGGQFAQGFFYAPARPAGEAARWLTPG